MMDKLIATVIPRTISKQGEHVKVAATLVLRPGTINDPPVTIKDQKESNSPQLFETWPTVIHGLFAAHGAVSAELGITDSAGKSTSTKDGHEIKPVLSTTLTTYPDISMDSGFGGLKFKDITKIWRQFLQDDDHTLTGLRTALKDTTADPNHPYKDVQQGPDAPSKDAPNIVGMPRTELAQQITMARAQALIARVNGRTPSRQAFLGEGAYFERPWARAATATERHALDSVIFEPRARDVAGFTSEGTPVVFAADAPPPAPPAQLPFDPHRYWRTTKDSTPTTRAFQSPTRSSGRRSGRSWSNNVKTKISVTRARWQSIRNRPAMSIRPRAVYQDPTPANLCRPSATSGPSTRRCNRRSATSATTTGT